MMIGIDVLEAAAAPPEKAKDAQARRDAVLAVLRPRLDHADVNPVVEFAPNGDQNPITVEHSVMVQLFRIEPFRSHPGYQPLRDRLQSPSVQGMCSTEYSGLWIRIIVNQLENDSKPAVPAGAEKEKK